MKIKLFLFFVLVSGMVIAIASILAENPSYQRHLPESIQPIVRKASKTVYSMIIKVPTPSLENIIKLPPLPPPTDPDFLALRDNLQREIDSACCDIAVSVTDLQNGQAINIKGDEPRLPGCTMNFFVLLSIMMDLQNGQYDESEVGQTISDTVWSSNAITARDLLIKTGEGDLYQGIDKVNDLLAFLGLKRGSNPAIMDHPPAYPHESLFGQDNNITANQTNKALEELYNGKVLNSEWRDYFLKKLTDVNPGLSYLIPAGVGVKATVSHKNGFFADATGWVDNDIGIVVFERNGKTYVYAISLYMERIPWKYADIPIGQTISSLVWQYFNNKYQ